MSMSDDLARRIETYLAAVDRNLSHKPPAVRREILADLRAHIEEALRREGGLGLNALERVLGAMDAPEDFAERAETPSDDPPPGPPRRTPARAGQRWFWLALGFMLVNAYGVWKWAGPQARPEAAPPSEQPAAPPALALLEVQQVNLSAAREATLRLEFNIPPNQALLPRFLKLSAKNQADIPYRVQGPIGTNTLWIHTGPIMVRRLTLTLGPGLPGHTGGVASAHAFTAAIELAPEFNLRRIDAESPAFEPVSLFAEFNAFPDPNGAASFIEIEPAVRYTVEAQEDWRRAGLRLAGEFKPGSVYSVTFKAGLPASSGSSLDDSITRLIDIPDRAAALQVDVPGRYLSPEGPLAIPVSLVNLKRWHVSVQPVFANNLVHLALREAGDLHYYGPTAAWLTGAAITRTNAVSAPRNERVQDQVRLRELIAEPRGAYWLEAEGQGRLIVVSDLGLSARMFPGGALIWVNGLASGLPVSGAEVAVYAGNNQVLARGLTDDQGLARLEYDANGEQAPYLVTASRNGDLSFVGLKRSGVDQGPGLEGPPYLHPGDLQAAVFTERGVYRPGEPVFVQALVRTAALEAPDPFPARLLVHRPDGRLFQDVPVTLDALGAAHSTVTLPDYLPAGRYRFELAMPGTLSVLGATTAALEEFVPPQLRVTVAADTNRYRAGTGIVFRVLGEHLFGRPAAGRPVQGYVTVQADSFAPPAWAGWVFGDPDKAFAPIHRRLDILTLNDDGRARFVAETASAWQPPAALKVLCQATVLEAGGRPVSAFGGAPVDAYPLYLGLRPAWDGTLRVGETQRVSVAVVQPDGAPAAEPVPLTLTLSRVEWNSVLRETGQGRYEWKSERQATVIREDAVTAGGEARDWFFSVDGMGEYMLLARDPASGAATRLFFHAASPESEWVSWSCEKPGRVELAWDRERYRPGETARLLVKAPFAGAGLLTVESDRVLEARAVTLADNTIELEVPVEAAYAPNVYCVVTLVRPARAERVWSPHRAIGAIALPVEPPDRRLTVSFEAPARHRPQSRLPVRLAVRDDAGRPASGAVTLMAVDEEICMLTAHETPDPNAVFLARRGLGVSLHDLYHDLMPILEDTLAAASAPGGDMGTGMRRRLNPIRARRFKPVSLWQAAVPLDAGGNASVELDLPEFTGTLRLMAVAYNGRQAGATNGSVQVKRDFIVQPALPRFMAPGDVSEASVTVFNEGTAEQTARVRATCGGPLRGEPAEQSVLIAPGASACVPLRLEAGPSPGKAVCRIEAECGDERYEEAIELPVRPASGLRTSAQSAVLAAGESVTLEPPADWLPATIEHTGAISALPALQWGRALDYVWHYPFGCLEQTVSGAFPLLRAADWVPRMLPGAAAEGDIAARVREAIFRSLSMQQDDGGFAFWPFMSDSDSALSLYGVHFLVEARASGADVPGDRLDAALGWLRARLDTPAPLDVGERAWMDDMDERAYACHILALAGSPDVGWTARLREVCDRLYFAARVHTAAALLLSGEPRQATAILDTLGVPTPRPRIAGRLLNSDVRDAALLLSAWLDVDPAHPAVGRLAAFLESRRRDGHWGTTHDNAMALLALGKYARTAGVEQPYAGTLTRPGAEPAALSSTQDVHWAHGPGAAGAMTITNRGPGRLFLWSRYTGVGSKPEPAVEQGVSLRREFFDSVGAPLDPASLPQGELVVVRLAVDTLGQTRTDLVIEDLLPAGWEIENPNLMTSRPFGWLEKQAENARFRDARDDRMLFFTGSVHGTSVFYYAARAVTAGVYMHPPATVSGMYEPDIRAVCGGGTVHVTP